MIYEIGQKVKVLGNAGRSLIYYNFSTRRWRNAYIVGPRQFIPGNEEKYIAWPTYSPYYGFEWIREDDIKET